MVNANRNWIGAVPTSRHQIPTTSYRLRSTYPPGGSLLCICALSTVSQRPVYQARSVKVQDKKWDAHCQRLRLGEENLDNLIGGIPLPWWEMIRLPVVDRQQSPSSLLSPIACMKASEIDVRPGGEVMIFRGCLVQIADHSSAESVAKVNSPVVTVL